MNVPHALMRLQEKRVDRSLGEAQLTSGMGKVQIRRKRQSMVMGARLCAGYLPNECKSCCNQRRRVKQCARIVQRLKSIAVPIQVKSAGCCSPCGAHTQRTLMRACAWVRVRARGCARAGVCASGGSQRRGSLEER